MQGQSFNYKLQPNLKNLQYSNSMYVFWIFWEFKRKDPYDKGFLIAIHAKRYKVFFSTSMSYLLMNVTTRTVIRCYFVLFMLTIWTSSMSNTIIRGEKYQNSKFIRYLCFKSEEKELNTSRCNLRRQERSWTSINEIRKIGLKPNEPTFQWK